MLSFQTSYVYMVENKKFKRNYGFLQYSFLKKIKLFMHLLKNIGFYIQLLLKRYRNREKKK